MSFTEISGHEVDGGTLPEPEWRAAMKSEEVFLEKQSLKPVVGYVLHVSHGGENWEIARRFNHFWDLDTAVRASGITPIDLPAKSVFDFISTPSETARQRSPSLRAYIDALAKSPSASALPAFQQWLSRDFQSGLIPISKPERAGFLDTDSTTFGLWSARRYFSLLADGILCWWTPWDHAFVPKRLDPPTGALSLVDLAVTRPSRCRIEIRKVRDSAPTLVLTSTSEAEIEAWAFDLSRASAVASVPRVPGAVAATAAIQQRSVSCCHLVGGRVPI